jgi:hypothetical protein
MTPKQLAEKIKKFRPHPPITDLFEGALRKRGRWGTKPVWYVSQKQHWLGWLSEYDSPGYYGRKNRGQSAEFAYNHIMCPPMLLWLAEASGVAKKKVIEANKAAFSAPAPLAAQCAALRRSIQWDMIEPRLSRK